MAIVAATNQSLPVFEYAARQVKQTVVGIGSAEKSQVQHMVRTLLSCLPIRKRRCGGCAGDRHHPLPCQSECRDRFSETRLNLARGRLR